jgi:DNA-binding FrmR family transcriptional regulator
LSVPIWQAAEHKARGAINSLMGNLMKDHILNHMPKNSKPAEEAAENMAESSAIVHQGQSA